MSVIGPRQDSAHVRPRSGTLERLRRLAAAASLITALAGGLVLLGWLLRMEFLKTLGLGRLAMNPVSAAAFILSGAALGLLHRETGSLSRRLGKAFGVVVALIGLAKLVAFVIDGNAGLDQWLGPGAAYSRMAPNTALNFLLAGLGLLLLRAETRRGIRPAQLCWLAVALIALMAVVGHTYQWLSIHRARIQIPVALSTALMFLLLSLGGVCANPDRGLMAVLTSTTAGGATARRLLPAAVLIPLLLGAVQLIGERLGWYRPGASLVLFTVGGMVTFALLVWWHARLLHRAELERQRVERRLTVQSTVTRILAEARGLSEALPQILRAICESIGWKAGGMWEVDPRTRSLRCVETWLRSPDLAPFEAASRQVAFQSGVGLPGRVWASGEPAWIPDVQQDRNFPRAPAAAAAGLHGALGFPIRRGQEVLGVMEFFSREVQQPDKDLLQMLANAGSQMGQFIERQRAEAALRDSEALYRSLVDTLPINVLRKDLAGKISFTNKFYCETIGKSPAELLGRTDFDLFPAELAAKYVADDRKVIETRKVFEDIEQHQTAGGEDLYMHVLKAPVFDAAGAVVGTQVIFWDVTARKRAEEALARVAADLKRSNEELEQFAYVASHDLQEPLRMVASYTQLLARRYEDKLDQDAKEFIGYAVEGAKRMQRLINDLLAYSRVGTRGKPFETVDLGHVLAAARDNLQIAIEENQAVITHDPLPTVPGDPVQLTQLFQNLLGNGIKFRGTAPPRIHIHVQRRTTPATAPDHPPVEEWVIGVADNGIGIEPRYFERIFIIFARLHTREEYPGTGIGLAVCKKIVERHGGRIWVESEFGKGAKFCFTLPVLPAAH